MKNEINLKIQALRDHHPTLDKHAMTLLQTVHGWALKDGRTGPSVNRLLVIQAEKSLITFQRICASRKTTRIPWQPVELARNLKCPIGPIKTIKVARIRLPLSAFSLLKCKHSDNPVL